MIYTMTENKDETTNPIFVLGITQRSGTNFLGNLLVLHPDCEYPSPIYEDLLLEDSQILNEYADKLYSRWDSKWGVNYDTKKRLKKAIGSGLITFLRSHLSSAEKRLVSKTPSVKNLNSFFQWFPEAKLIIIIRDGRSVVESYVKSFSFSYETAMQLWADRAKIIVDFMETNKNNQKGFMLVKYENIFSENKKEMEKILTFLNLDKTKYDFESAKKMPVHGSSELKTKSEGIHWEPVAKTTNFNPLARYSNWDISKHRMFNRIAGKYLYEFGYETGNYVPDKVTLFNKIVEFIKK
jgi:protein-tyrosine sulfotransferase